MSEFETSSTGLPAFSTLTNLHKIIPSADIGYFAVENHLFFEFVSLFLRDVEVDETWYIDKYPDVRDALEARQVRDPRDHFIRFGYFEHRMPYFIEVDGPWYEKTYEDVADAISKGVFSSAQHHFELVGYREGRLPFANFALKKRQENVT